MMERRKEERLKIVNEIAISVIAANKIIPIKKGFPYNYSKDISAHGTKIQSNILLPVDTLLRIELKLKTLGRKITSLGKVKWVKVNIDDKSYDEGIEFIDTPGEAIEKIKFYISQIRKLHRADQQGQEFRHPLNKD